MSFIVLSSKLYEKFFDKKLSIFLARKTLEFFLTTKNEDSLQIAFNFIKCVHYFTRETPIFSRRLVSN